MERYKLFNLISILIFILSYAENSSVSVFHDKLKSSKKILNSILNDIFLKWQVKDFPTFLKSVAMTSNSWELLKVRNKFFAINYIALCYNLISIR